MKKAKHLYTLWNPESEFPPRKTYPNYAEALRVGKIMARKNPKETFHVVRIVASVCVLDGDLQQATYSGVPDKQASTSPQTAMEVLAETQFPEY